MMKRSFFFLVLVWMVLITWEISPAFGQKEFHGADSVFEKEGITILWAILKGPTEESSWVYIKIIDSGGIAGHFQIFSVEAVDPFSKAREWVVKGEKLGKENVMRGVRSSFRDKTGRRILFYKSIEDFKKENPALTIFYLGVPDTSPEFLSEKDLEGYFNKALEKLKKR
jgi:hypothetical protein